MIDTLFSLPEGLSTFGFWGLMVGSFAGSLITVGMGIGGGALMLAVLASFVPPTALIPVHGVVQLGSNAGRLAMMWRQVSRPALPAFILGSVVGSALGGLLVVDLPAHLIQIGVGVFVIYSLYANPPAWLSRWPLLIGCLSSFLTMFFGATGLFVANYVKALDLARHSHVATQAALMAVQHALKVAIFGVLGFAFGQWLAVISALILAGLVGTFVGQLFLNRITDRVFHRALNILLTLIALRLIWDGVSG
jgi:uncharacterized membrane protein YfcA